MLTVSVYFRIKNHDLFNGEDGYMKQQMDFETSKEPKGLQEIMTLPESIRKNLVKSFKLTDSDVEIISRLEYEECTEDEEGEISEFTTKE